MNIIKRIISGVIYLAMLIGVDNLLGFNFAILVGMAMVLVELTYPNK